MIAGQEQGDGIALAVLAHHALDGGAFGAVQEFRQLGDGMDVGGMHLAQLGLGEFGGLDHAFGNFGIRRETALAADQVGFARIRQCHELAGQRAADLAAVRFDGTEVQAQAIADALIGTAHLLVGLMQGFVGGMEAVRVLHDELAAAHEAEAGTALVAVLHLDLIQVQRELPVGAQLIAHQIGDDFLMGGSQAQAEPMTVVKAHHFGTVCIPTAAFRPQLSRLKDGHAHFLGTGGVHFLTDDLLDLPDHAPT